MAQQGFGGAWTEEKLRRVRKYLEAYAIALKNQPFGRIYIDAFAGTGYRNLRANDTQAVLPLEGFNEFAKGSARMALEVEPPFTRYLFIESNRGRFKQLEDLRRQFPLLADRMVFENRDANEAIRELCQQTDWRRNRAVMFLDPYGMQVDWATIESIAATKAIDLWYLFPAGIGVGRMLPRKSKVPGKWQARLDACLGDKSWRTAFYDMQEKADLFSMPEAAPNRSFDIERAERYFSERLRSVFIGVAKRALPLHRPKGPCMYLLFFACGNDRGKRVALNIANHILAR